MKYSEWDKSGLRPISSGHTHNFNPSLAKYISKTRILRQKHWKPLQIAGKNDLLKIKQYITLKTMFTWGIPIPGVVRDCMQAIHGILTEVHDFALCY